MKKNIESYTDWRIQDYFQYHHREASENVNNLDIWQDKNKENRNCVFGANLQGFLTNVFNLDNNCSDNIRCNIIT